MELLIKLKKNLFLSSFRIVTFSLLNIIFILLDKSLSFNLKSIQKSLKTYQLLLKLDSNPGGGCLKSNFLIDINLNLSPIFFGSVSIDKSEIILFRSSSVFEFFNKTFFNKFYLTIKEIYLNKIYSNKFTNLGSISYLHLL